MKTESGGGLGGRHLAALPGAPDAYRAGAYSQEEQIRGGGCPAHHCRLAGSGSGGAEVVQAMQPR